MSNEVRKLTWELSDAIVKLIDEEEKSNRYKRVISDIIMAIHSGAEEYEICDYLTSIGLGFIVEEVGCM